MLTRDRGPEQHHSACNTGRGWAGHLLQERQQRLPELRAQHCVEGYVDISGLQAQHLVAHPPPRTPQHHLRRPEKRQSDDMSWNVGGQAEYSRATHGSRSVGTQSPHEMGAHIVNSSIRTPPRHADVRLNGQAC